MSISPTSPTLSDTEFPTSLGNGCCNCDPTEKVTLVALGMFATIGFFLTLPIAVAFVYSVGSTVLLFALRWICCTNSPTARNFRHTVKVLIQSIPRQQPYQREPMYPTGQTEYGPFSQTLPTDRRAEQRTQQSTLPGQPQPRIQPLGTTPPLPARAVHWQDRSTLPGQPQPQPQTQTQEPPRSLQGRAEHRREKPSLPGQPQGSVLPTGQRPQRRGDQSTLPGQPGS